jgi:polyhydroxyalkanoate synthesis regulator phasin
MATKTKQQQGALGKLTSKGEEAVTRLMEELGKNPRVTDALARTMAAKGKVDAKTRATLRDAGLATADGIKELRLNLEKLEKRLQKLEGNGSKTTPPRSGTRKTAAKKPAAKTTAAKKPAAKKPAARKPAAKKPSA